VQEKLTATWMNISSHFSLPLHIWWNGPHCIINCLGQIIDTRVHMCAR